MRNVGAVLLGLFLGSILNLALLQLNTVFFPMPEGMDPEDMAQLAAYVATLPVTGFLLVLAAHVGQAVLGGAVASYVGDADRPRLGLVVGVMTALGSAFNQVALSGPLWMWIDPVLCVAAGWGMGMVTPLRQPSAD